MKSISTSLRGKQEKRGFTESKHLKDPPKEVG